MASDQELNRAFYLALVFLKDRIERDGWVTYSANYLREHVRCRFGYRFSNTISPKILRNILKQHPELKPIIKVNALKRQTTA
jgi:hypothetical protein